MLSHSEADGLTGFVSTWSLANQETLHLAVMEAVQFGHAFDRILREILLVNIAHGSMYLIKTDLSDGFYRVDVASHDIPKLGVIFPSWSA